MTSCLRVLQTRRNKKKTFYSLISNDKLQQLLNFCQTKKKKEKPKTYIKELN